MMIKVLGSGQDAGVPQTGCSCDICRDARLNPEHRRLGPSIALMDKEKGYCYLVDASFDFKYQIDMVREEDVRIVREGTLPVSGIFLTHAHYGHCAGLLELGKEAANENNMPVYCTPKMVKFLRENNPFRLLIEGGNIEIVEFSPEKEISFKGFTCFPFSVSHRNEISDCVGFSFVSKDSKKTLVYIPDVNQWTEQALKRIEYADFALIDGTFYSRTELSRFESVPHPPIEETMEVLEGKKGRIYFTHINHTNPVNRKGEERNKIESHGFNIAFDKMTFEL